MQSQGRSQVGKVAMPLTSIVCNQKKFEPRYMLIVKRCKNVEQIESSRRR